jgi:hypothetical protein
MTKTKQNQGHAINPSNRIRTQTPGKITLTSTPERLPLYPKNTPLVQGNSYPGKIIITQAISPTLARPSRKTKQGHHQAK